MTDAPERLWLASMNGEDWESAVCTSHKLDASSYNDKFRQPEYLRADIVDQMVAEAAAKERERCSGIADRFATAMHDGAQQIKHRYPEIAYDRDDTASDLKVLADLMREGGE